MTTPSTPDFLAPLPKPILPIEGMNKKDLYAHLQEFHSEHVGSWHGVTSKSSRDAMEEIHAKAHEKTDYTQAVQSLQIVPSEYGDRQVWVNNPQPAPEGTQFARQDRQVHEHIFVTATTSEDDRKTLDAVTGGSLGRVLVVTERKALERLIDNDFAALRNEMNAYAKEILESRLEGVRNDFAAKQKDAEKAQKAGAKLVTDLREKLLKQVEDAKADGITLTFPSIPQPESVGVSVAGLVEAEKKVKAENQSDLASGLHTLERQRLASQRLVLLAGISPEGQQLLNTIPSAKNLMIEAAQDRANKAITA